MIKPTIRISNENNLKNVHKEKVKYIKNHTAKIVLCLVTSKLKNLTGYIFLYITGLYLEIILHAKSLLFHIFNIQKSELIISKR